MTVYNPLVSVVIPCYNQAHFLGEAIESVLKQTYQHFEIIVIDDGSKDNVSEVADRYPQALCVRQHNQGVAIARNNGLQHSKGEFVVFLDADDRLLPNALEAGVNRLSTRPECAFSAGMGIPITYEGLPKQPPALPLIEKDHYLALLLDNFIWMPAMVVFRRSKLEAIGGFNGAVSPSEDYEMYLRLSRTFPVDCHGEAVAEHREHNANASSNYERMLKATLATHRLQQPYVQGNKKLEEAYKAGKLAWQGRYGNPLFDKVSILSRNAFAERSDIKQLLHLSLLLLKYDPQGINRRICRRIVRLPFKIGRRQGSELSGT